MGNMLTFNPTVLGCLCYVCLFSVRVTAKVYTEFRFSNMLIRTVAKTTSSFIDLHTTCPLRNSIFWGEIL